MAYFKQFARGAVFILAILAFASAMAQDYPTRPVTIVVPFAAGGGTDIIARLLAQKLEQRLGKSFVIDNKSGAGSTLGAAAAARAAPDGHTLLMAPSPAMAMSVSIYKSLPYNPAIDFIPIALAAQTPFVLIVNPSLPIHSVADLIRLAKEKPGQLSYGSAGPGTPHHLYAELFRKTTRTAAWQHYLTDNQFQDAFMSPEDTRKFLGEFDDRLRGLLTAAGVTVVR